MKMTFDDIIKEAKSGKIKQYKDKKLKIENNINSELTKLQLRKQQIAKKIKEKQSMLELQKEISKLKQIEREMSNINRYKEKFKDISNKASQYIQKTYSVGKILGKDVIGGIKQLQSLGIKKTTIKRRKPTTKRRKRRKY